MWLGGGGGWGWGGGAGAGAARQFDTMLFDKEGVKISARVDHSSESDGQLYSYSYLHE